MQNILYHFPDLSQLQISQLERLYPLYAEWNQKINVISRKDIENLYLNHVLHSLTITKFLKFDPKATLLDLGTGGGFPSIPLAIYYPDLRIVALDGTGKKIKVVKEIATELKLENIIPLHARVEDISMKFNFIVSRAVAELDQLYRWALPLLNKKQIQALPNGLIAYKGGNISAEVKALPKGSYYEIWNISEQFKNPFFDEKYLIYVQGN